MAARVARPRGTTAWTPCPQQEEKDARARRRAEKDELRERLRVEHEANQPDGAEPSPFNEALVILEASRLAEAEACAGEGADSVTVLTAEELGAAESAMAVTLELRMTGIDEHGIEMTRGAMNKNERRRDEMRRRRDQLTSARAEAQAALRAAVGSNSREGLEAALQRGRAAALEGSHEEDGIGARGKWVTGEMRDAYLLLAEHRRADEGRMEEARRREQLRALPVRTDLLGTDRWGRRYWALESGSSELWVQPRMDGTVGVLDEPPADAHGAEPGGEEAWQVIAGEESCEALASSLDARGVRERGLQLALKQWLQEEAMRRRVQAEDGDGEGGDGEGGEGGGGEQAGGGEAGGAPADDESMDDAEGQDE